MMAEDRMNDQVIRLELLRQEVQAFNYLAGSLYDYLDHGNPNERQRREASAQIAEHEKQSVESLQQLHEALVALRAAAPQIVEEWVRWHMGICQRITAEGKKGEQAQDGSVSDQDVRLYVAGETLSEWEKVLKGDQDFVSINEYYLSDYDEQVTAAVERGKDGDLARQG
jgi:hypothetical protein